MTTTNLAEILHIDRNEQSEKVKAKVETRTETDKARAEINVCLKEASNG